MPGGRNFERQCGVAVENVRGRNVSMCDVCGRLIPNPFSVCESQYSHAESNFSQYYGSATSDPAFVEDHAECLACGKMCEFQVDGRGGKTD